MLKLWGDTVIEQIKLELASRKIDISVFLKIPVTECRVKELASAIGKISRKGYTDPLTQMEDLVGARFVVLLTDHLNVLTDIITSNDSWSSSKDNDYSERIARNPELFDYQSIHFVVRSKESKLTSRLGIPPNIPCEIQIRTLLQHAYAELTHDNIYKPSIPTVPYQARRLIARSMALMESTDELFCKTLEKLNQVTQVRNEINTSLTQLYESLIGNTSGIDYQFNVELLDAYHDKHSKELYPEIEKFINDRPFITSRINERVNDNYLFQQPVILFLYWLVKNHDNETTKSWPYESLRSELSLIYSDLGVSQNLHV
ncbi:MAG: hypothetical protein EWV58_05870 [Microcystis aeruginosa Ma_MB_F_20061100_S19]|nr:MAG: hypothetical protein EWV58_05870 [Microcystis aeruginosa Ma_MB_F_20061100_S19]